jgi:hypothetical protein
MLKVDEDVVITGLNERLKGSFVERGGEIK